MQPAPLPENENDRLEALLSLQILDTSVEERFDRLTRLARRLFNTPIAVVSLVDKDRQWFKSCLGLNFHEGPREASFCGHALMGDQPLVVPDARLDPRFADMPLVVESPKVRFYAGQPIKGPNGFKLGTLCVMDKKPRSLDEQELSALQDLAAMVEDEIAAAHYATMDDLTELSNRRGFIMLAEYVLNLCVRNGHSAQLLYFDLNNFKQINDRLGHATGDLALTSFAGLMKESFRGSDVIARLGGDEFVVLLSDAKEERVSEILQRFMLCVADYNHFSGNEFMLDFSVGHVAFEPALHRVVDDLLRDADEAMYRSKESKGATE